MRVGSIRPIGVWTAKSSRDGPGVRPYALYMLKLGQFVTGKLGQFVSAIGRGREGLLQLVIWHPVITTNPDVALCYINVLWSVGRGFPDDVRPGCGGGF